MSQNTDLRVLRIRETIAAAKLEDSQNHILRRYLEEKLPKLHHTIRLPNSRAAETLEKFITDYIDHVPDFIEALSTLAQEAGVYEQAKKFLTIAEDYFLAPPEVVEQTTGLKGLIDEAYLAHRLIEEINDRMMMASGVPLSPMDMTLSNLIVHELLNDDFANQLDLAVHYAIESLFESDNFFKNADFTNYLKKHQESGWSQAINNWPCLAGDSAISLQLNKQDPGPNIH